MQGSVNITTHLMRTMRALAFLIVGPVLSHVLPRTLHWSMTMMRPIIGSAPLSCLMAASSSTFGSGTSMSRPCSQA